MDNLKEKNKNLKDSIQSMNLLKKLKEELKNKMEIIEKENDETKKAFLI